MNDKVGSIGSRFDYLILGAGPAGLQLAYFLEKAGRSYLVLERGPCAGHFFKKFPRHRQLISINKVHTGYDDHEINMRWDWNSLICDSEELRFKNYTHDYFPDADCMVDYLGDFASHYDLNIRYNTEIAKVSKAGSFRLHASDGEVFTAPRFIVATGLSRPYLPPIDGIEDAENYTEVSVDKDEFAGKRVLVIGKGNSAFETADHLISRTALLHVASPAPVKFAWKTHFVGHLRAVNNNFLDTYQLKSQNAVLDCTIKKIRRREDGRYAVSVSYSHADGEAEVLTYDRVICCTGFRFDDSIFDDSCRPELTINDRFPAQTAAWESVNVPGLYIAGTLTQMRDFKKYTSGFIHGFRYNARALYRILEARYHDNAWPSRDVELDSRSLTEAMIERINTTSGLWQMFGYFCDALIPEGSSVSWYEEMPFDYVKATEIGESPSYFTVNLEFGKCQEDPFLVERHPDPDRGAESFFLHPVVRHWSAGELLAEHHVLEDLEAEWYDEDQHVLPLRSFLDEALERHASLTRVAKVA